MDEPLAVMEATGGNPRPDTPLLLHAADAAALCAVSMRTWRSWDASGNIPQPIRIGRSTRWRPDELKAWVAAGCPRRAEWETLQKSS